MKGITHFSAGVAVAGLIPGVLESAAAGNPLPLIAGGFFGLLPDTIDFKFRRFMCRYDLEITPDPLAPDPVSIAQALSRIIGVAAVTERELFVKLNTVRISEDRWLGYSVELLPAQREVRVVVGPEIDGMGVPRPGSRVSKTARQSVTGSFIFEYESVIKADILDGPVLGISSDLSGLVKTRFLPWHRDWTHSYCFGTGIGLVLWAFFGPIAGLVGAFAQWSHVLLDQVGFMGSSLFYPFVKKRYSGMKMAHSSSWEINIFTVWVCMLAIFWSVFKMSSVGINMNPLRWAFWGLALPCIAYRLVAFLDKRR